MKLASCHSLVLWKNCLWKTWTRWCGSLKCVGACASQFHSGCRSLERQTSPIHLFLYVLTNNTKNWKRICTTRFDGYFFFFWSEWCFGSSNWYIRNTIRRNYTQNGCGFVFVFGAFTIALDPSVDHAKKHFMLIWNAASSMNT